MERLTASKEDRYWQDNEFWVSALEPGIDEIESEKNTELCRKRLKEKEL